MESPPKFVASPGTPLFPLSPERVNGTRPPYSSTLGQSPSMPEFGKPSLGGIALKPSLLSGSPDSHFRHSRNNSASDAHVQGLVARFDGLSVKDYKAQSEVAIRRADMAREMAEMERDKSRREAKALDEEIRKMREDLRKMKKDAEEGKERERKGVKRLEVVMEEYHRAKETHNHAVSVYEKEVRKSRKEAFKSGSSMVKLQEELRATRNSLRITQSGLDSERLKSARREQDAFTAQYQLIGVQEELQKAQERIQVIETERDALKTSLKEEEVARIAAEGQIALPAMNDDDEEDLLLHSPRKSPRKPRLPSDDGEECDKENRVPKKTLELQNLHQELVAERRLRERAQEQVDFMKMECQFRICSCRIADSYVHDSSLETDIKELQTLHQHAGHEAEDIGMTVDAPEDVEQAEAAQMPEAEQPLQDSADGLMTEISQASLVESTDVPLPGSDNTVVSDDAVSSSPSRTTQDTQLSTSPPTLQHEPSTFEDDIERGLELQTPVREIRTITTTTTIPIAFSPYPAKTQPATPMTIGHPPMAAPSKSPFNGAFNADGTLDREAALAQIRERRGRARSVALNQATPRKQMVVGVERRDISAPVAKGAGKWS